MGRNNRKKPAKGMWLTWLAIFLIVAGMVQEFLWMFFDGMMLLWAGLGCFVAGIATMAYLGDKQENSKQ